MYTPELHERAPSLEVLEETVLLTRVLELLTLPNQDTLMQSAWRVVHLLSRRLQLSAGSSIAMLQSLDELTSCMLRLLGLDR